MTSLLNAAFGLSAVYSLRKKSKGRETGERTGLAVIDVGFTVASSEARFTATAVTAQSVLAGCSIATWILHTLFDVHLTCLALEGWKGGDKVNFTLSLNSGTKQLHMGNRIR